MDMADDDAEAWLVELLDYNRQQVCMAKSSTLVLLNWLNCP